IVILAPGQSRFDGLCDSPHCRSLRDMGECCQRCQPRASLRVEPMDHPESPERSGEQDAVFGIALLQTPLKSGPQVVLFALERCEGSLATRAAVICISFPSLRVRQEESRMLCADRIQFA